MRTLLAAALLASVASPVIAAPVRQYDALAIAPRGDTIAAVEHVEGGAAGAAHGVITLRATKSGRILRTLDPCAACTYSDLTFAPDGTLAWLARDKAAGIVTLAIDTGAAPHVVATVGGIAETPRFSPDGKRIALLVTVGAAKERGANQAGVRQIGEIGEANDEQRLAVFDVAGAPVAAADIKPLSPAGRYVYEYDWTPDGKGFVATSALGNGDNKWWVATLDAIDAATGAVRTIAKPKTQLNFPRVSPDGQTVAFVGGLMSDFGSVGGDVWTVPFAGGEPTDATAGAKFSVTSIDWRGAAVQGTALGGSEAGLVSIGVGIGGARGGTIGWHRPVRLGAGDGDAAFSADGKAVAMVVEDFAHAPAIFAGPVNAPVRITLDNDTAPALAAARSLTWKSDGYDVQGWLLAPVGADPKKQAAMVTIVHGGPAAANTPRYVLANSEPGALLAAGYYVFLPNPRGSYGQGEAFTAANKRDFGGGDLRDILAGIDAAERAAPIDDARLGLTGGSYGGFMAMWANTQTNRFKAIVAGAGLSNWVSYYGTNGIDQWMLPFFGKTLYEDYAAYEAPSAIYHIRSAKTPTFIWAGERDIEVPPTQSTEYWHALKDLGVPVSLVIYSDEGHGVRAPAHVTDLRARTVAWFDKYLK